MFSPNFLSLYGGAKECDYNWYIASKKNVAFINNKTTSLIVSFKLDTFSDSCIEFALEVGRKVGRLFMISLNGCLLWALKPNLIRSVRILS